MAVSDAGAVDNSGMEIVQKGPDRTTLIAFLMFVLIAGGAPVAVRFTYGELAPFWSAFLRFMMAALIFWILMVVKGVPIPKGRVLFGAVIFGTLSVGAAFLFLYFGLVRTESSLASTLVATVPLLTLFFAAFHKLEKIRRKGIIGGLLALTGIAVTVQGSLFSGVEISLPHVLAILAAAACFAEAGIIAKLFPPCHPYSTNAIAMTVGAIILFTASIIQSEPMVLPTQATVWSALLYLMFSSVAVFLLYLFILGRWTASGASYSFVLNPLVTIVLASFLTEETISPLFLGGAAIVLIGVYVGALLPEKDPKAAVDPDIQVRPAVPNCS